MSDIAIQLTDVCKHFKLYDNPVTGPIKELLFFWRRDQYFKRFTTVRDVSFKVNRGEVVGIIGPNGAGKTTLLKMIAGLLRIDEGTIDINGKVTALLALGVGVHPEFTGRLNAVYGAMLLGMTKAEAQAKLPSIIEFAELGEFIDQPFRTYSSGMRARLLFSVAMSVEPDILIVDEALATGDAYFISKCRQRIEQICNEGATILLVTHNLTYLQELCDRVIVLDHGAVINDSTPMESIAVYGKAVNRQIESALSQARDQSKGVRIGGTGEIVVEDACFMVQGQRQDTITIGRPCQLRIDISAKAALEDVRIVLRVYSGKSAKIYAYLPPAPSFQAGEAFGNVFPVGQGKSRITFEFEKLLLGDGIYHVEVVCFSADPDFHLGEDNAYCWYYRAMQFQAVYKDPSFFGRGTLSEIPISGIRLDRI